MAVAVVMSLLAGPAAEIAAAAPEYVSPPYIGGNERLGERLTCSSGTWKNRPRWTYEWVREGISFLESPTYTLTKADEHKEVWCVVTATEGSEKTVVESANSICLGGNCGITEPPEEPVNKKRPEVSPSGTVEVGKTLTCSQGEWSGRPPPTFTYKWLRDKAEAIKSATSNTYQLVSEDEGHTLSCEVTAKNEMAEKTVESTNSVTVPGSPPKNIKQPKVLGVPAVNETLTCYEGTWTGSQPLTFGYRWLRNGAEIPMAAGPTRMVEPADEGQSLSCKVIAENRLGKAEAVSATVTVSGKLKSTGPPNITGTPEAGHTLKCSEGGWNEPTGELTLKYQWLRENETILGATSKEYEVAGVDRGHVLYCQVVAKNKRNEEAVALSGPVTITKPGAPKNEGLPEVTGTPGLVGQLTCKEGTWSNSPTQYVFEWLREKVAIASANEQDYVVVKGADEGHSLSCRVTAKNGQGASEPKESAQTFVSGEAPKVTTPPEVYAGSATPRVGESVTCLRGEWSGAPAPTFTYEWLRDGTTEIGSNAAYTIASLDRGHSLSCHVTASNGEGSPVSASSSNSLHVPGSPPEPPLEGATVSGEAIVGSLLTCAPGSWNGQPEPAFTFQWLLNGAAIPSATGETFTVGSADRGYVISCRVTGKSSEGEASTVSKGVHVLGVRPEQVEPPFISGTAAIGQTLTCQRGVWNGKPPPSFTYRWFRDGVAVASATEGTYPVELADQSHLLSCNVTATNSVGSVESESINSVAIGSRLTQTIVEVPVTGHPLQPVLPSPGVILASLNRQLSFALGGAHLKSVVKAGGYAFSFIAPTGGTLEVLWYAVMKGAHGAKSKQLLVGQSNNASFAFTGSRKSTIKVRLTSNGRKLLKHKKRISLKAKAIFTIPKGNPVIWSVTLVLSR